MVQDLTVRKVLICKPSPEEGFVFVRSQDLIDSHTNHEGSFAFYLQSS